MSSLSCPVNLDVGRLKEEVEGMYARVAQNPDGDFHFNRGPEYAVSHLGYDSEELASLPAASTESFAGVGNPIAIHEFALGEVVLDVGSGAGMDLLLAAQRVGPSGKAIGVDMTQEMIDKCIASAKEAGLDNVELRKGDIHELPVADSEVDVVITNGVLNLAHDKLKAYGELFRVLKPGGRLQFADIISAEQLSDGIRNDFELWAA